MSEREINAHLDNGCSDDPRPTASASTQKGKMSQASITSLFNPSGKASQASPSGYYTQPFPSKSRHTRKRSEADDVTPPSKRPKVTASDRLQSAAPLAERLRPHSLEEFVGQPHLTEPDSLLMSHLDRGATGSIIFWGPPGYVHFCYVL